MKYVNTWILKIKLAAIFKQAEQLISQGKVAGDQAFVDLANQGQRLLASHIQQYSTFNPKVEIPAWNDLIDLTIKPVPADIKQQAVVISAVVCGAALTIGAFSALVAASFHAFSHVFHIIGL